MNRARQVLFWLVAAGAFAAFGSLSLSQNGLAFPLDDAWIHQGYARNLAQNGEWAFIPGQPSAGGTSFLWVLILALGHFLGLSPVIWALLLGLGLLAGSAWLALRLAQRFLATTQLALWLIPLILLLEWHLVWAAFSGMETLLLGFLGLLLFVLLAEIEQERRISQRAWLLPALILGAALATRPDGITLIGPAAASLLLLKGRWSEKWIPAALLVIVPLIIYAPFARLNLLASGSIWPNTLYAKQAEYALLLEQGLLGRLGDMALPLVTGVGALLIPGIIYFVYDQFSKRRYAGPLFAVWVLGYIALFAARLPLAYQHGRYVIPVIPVFLVLSLLGSFILLERLPSRRVRFVAQSSFVLASLAVSLVFFLLGRQALREDVAFIETQMRAVADWIAEEMPAGTHIAAHDIGALGYFAEPELYDLAGLVSPEVIPFIRDENLLAAYLDENEVEYLMIFPDWYPQLSVQGQVLFQAPDYLIRGAQQPGMAVIGWHD